LRAWAPGLLAAALAVLVYAATLGFAQAYDDQFVLRSPLLDHPFDLRAILSGGFYAHAERVNGLYRPLGQWSLVLNAVLGRALTGTAEAWTGYHAVNVLLHAAASFLVFAWLQDLLGGEPRGRWLAGCAAVLWSIHPTHAEVAANITARYESLALVFGLGFLIAHRRSARIRAWIAPALFLAALGCKESAVAFLPLAAFSDLLFPIEGRRWSVRDWLGSSAALALWFALRGAALSDSKTIPVFIENPVSEAPAWIRVLTAARVQLLYLRDQALPLWLSPDHSYADILPVRSPLDLGVLGFGAVAAIALAFACRARRKAPAIPLAVVGYAILFAPASNFAMPLGTIMADRLAYAPSIFTCLLAALLVARVRHVRARYAILVVLSAALSFASFRGARAWTNDTALGFAQVRAAPESAKAHGNLADALRRDGRLAEAVPEYLRSIEIYPYRPNPHQGLAQTYDYLGEDPEKSLEEWLRAIRFGSRPGDVAAEAALDAADLGDWKAFDERRQERSLADPYDPRLISADGARAAAVRLLREPKDLADHARGKDLLRRGAYADAERSLLRAIHKRDVPAKKLAEVLSDVATCNEALGKAPRAERFRRLAAQAGDL
jgi:tetratricopeptide (TPR) repeat protein